MKYLKILGITSIAFLLLAASCNEEEPKPTIEVDPPVITIIEPTTDSITVDLADTIRPHIRGTATTEGELTNVSVFAISGATEERILNASTFENSRLFEFNVRPNYAMGMTRLRISATDNQDQTTTQYLTVEVVYIPPVDPPTIAFTTPENLVVDFRTADLQNLPYIEGIVTTESQLTRVRVFALFGTGTALLQERTTFTDPSEYQINIQPVFSPNMTGIRVEAQDRHGQVVEQNFGFQVIDFDMPPDLPPATGNRLAFPTAEGGGRYTVGGRGGQVLVVSTLADNNNPGSFRWAISQNFPRTIVFDVAGEIILSSRLNINNHNVTIAGQSAPGDGITIRGDRFVLNNANQVIVRFLRIRPGRYNDGDAFEGNSQRDIILDHLSMSWADDEVASFYNNRYFTMQWSIISEPFGAEVNRGMGGLMGGHTATFANNLFAHTRSRNPRINGARLSGRNEALEMADFVNNVMFNFATSPNGGELGRYNFRNNYFRPGPATPGSQASPGTIRGRFLNLYARNETSANNATFRDLGRFYMSGNVMEGNATLTNNNWNNVALQRDSRSRAYNPAGGVRVDSVRVNTPFMQEWAINMRTAQQAFDVVLERAGASFKRDDVDTRVINEVRTGTATFGNGLVPRDMVPGNWHVHDVNAQPAQRMLRGTAQDDGIPDWFKIKHRLPLGQNMANRHSICPYFTNLEVYLNYIVEHIHN